MANRIIINGNQNRNESIFGHGDGSLGLGGDRSSQASQDAAPERTGISSGDRQNTVTPPLDENVWGNDRDILDKLDKEVLADRRLFVRVRYIQRITCNAVYEDIEKEPVFLSRPLEFITVDISAAGIGIVCEHEIEPGKILGIRITLDRMPYDIKAELYMHTAGREIQSRPENCRDGQTFHEASQDFRGQDNLNGRLCLRRVDIAVSRRSSVHAKQGADEAVSR